MIAGSGFALAGKGMDTRRLQHYLGAACEGCIKIRKSL
jgi:hypothetical protein